MSIFKTTIGLVLAAFLAGCGGGGGSARTPVTVAPAPSTAAIASLLLSAPSPLTVNADGTSSITLTVRALDASNGLVKGANVALTSSNASILSASLVTTDESTGLATVTLTANSGVQSTRVATVTATCASCSASAATLQVQINGATLTLSSSGGSSLTAGGNPVTLSAAVKDASGLALPGEVVTFATTDSLVLGVGATTATTNTLGVATATVSGLSAGSASVNVTALGNGKSQSFTVTSAVGTLAITSPANNAVMVTNIAQAIAVSAPGAGTINFASTLGTFSSPLINGNSGTSSLTATQAGSATVTVFDDIGRTASIVLKVSPPVSSANKIIMSASQTTVGLATVSATPTTRLTARALFSSGTVDQGVANVPILFSMTGGPGAGEYLTPAYQLTDSAGYAYADFFSGTSASVQNGITVAARIQGTAFQTGTAPSSNSVQLTVGGQALSVAIGAASVVRESTDKTLYLLDHSVQVTDAAGNAVPSAIVTLKVRPIAFSLGSGCSIASVAGVEQTYCSEDAVANGSLDAGEDGLRVLATSQTAGSICSSISTAPLPGATGSTNALLTPQNSVSGSVPATVTTDATGTANFVLTYLKASALWVVDQISATVLVNGTESGSSTIFRLPASTADVDLPDTCFIPPSPFSF